MCNLAARLCAEAKDGQILVSSRIAGEVEAVVKLEDLGNLALKGLSRPVAAFNVVHSASAADARPNIDRRRERAGGLTRGLKATQLSQFPSRPRRSLKGHQDAFPRPRLSARCRFSQRTFTRTRSNGRDALKAVPDASAQSVGRAARLSRNVRQSNHVLAN